MKPINVLGFAILAACAASAQVPVQSSQNQGLAGMEKVGSKTSQPATTVVIAPASACPVSMEAKQRGMTQMVKVGKNEAPSQRDFMPAPAQHIHLTLRGFAKDKRVTAALVTARGRSAHGRIENTQLTLSEGSSELSRTLDVTFTDDGNGTVSADLDLPAFTSVNAVQLQSIKYSDGSSWKLENRNVCTVTPDPVMLIAGR